MPKKRKGHGWSRKKNQQLQRSSTVHYPVAKRSIPMYDFPVPPPPITIKDAESIRETIWNYLITFPSDTLPDVTSLERYNNLVTLRSDLGKWIDYCQIGGFISGQPIVPCPVITLDLSLFLDEYGVLTDDSTGDPVKNDNGDVLKFVVE